MFSELAGSEFSKTEKFNLKAGYTKDFSDATKKPTDHKGNGA